MKRSIVLSLLVACAGLASAASAAPSDYFAIHVVDDATGRGVPLVRLETTDHVEYFTDSNGYVALNEPGLMGQDTWFGISSHGYEFPNEAFGARGTTLKPVAGGKAELKIHRLNIAERLYRITGRGIYRDTILLGKKPPIAHGGLNAGVTGQDTVINAIHNGKLYWFWGDTNRASFHLGNFNTTGATSLLPGKGGLDPSVGVDITYFTPTDNPNATKGMIPFRSAAGHPVWMGFPFVVKDNTGQERMLADFVKTSDLVADERGMTIFNDEKQVFEEFKPLPLKTALAPGGRPTIVNVDGKEYCYFGIGVRVPYTWDAITDPTQYEGFTCLTPDATYTKDKPSIARDAAGKPLWTWRKGAEPISLGQMDEMVASGALTKDQVPVYMQDAEGKHLRVQHIDIAWNDYRKKWTMIFTEHFGATLLGETWYAEANAPEGPWINARKVSTHAMKKNNQDFYNPIQHPEFAQDGGRLVYYEGTYTNSFSGTVHCTPLYEYNQVMYRLDLSDPRLKMPEPPSGWSNAQPVQTKP